MLRGFLEINGEKELTAGELERIVKLIFKAKEVTPTKEYVYYPYYPVQPWPITPIYLPDTAPAYPNPIVPGTGDQPGDWWKQPYTGDPPPNQWPTITCHATTQYVPAAGDMNNPLACGGPQVTYYFSNNVN